MGFSLYQHSGKGDSRNTPRVVTVGGKSAKLLRNNRFGQTWQMPMKDPVESFISHLYLSAGRIPPESYRVWALEQLQRVVDFDAAFWGTGGLQSREFHYVEHLGLDEHYGQRLVDTIDINPIREAVLGRLGEPVAMSEVYPDDSFFTSELHEHLFKPYGIERILASGHFDERSGLYTLLSLYRQNRDQDFSTGEKQLVGRLVFHMVAAASYNFFLHVEKSDNERAESEGSDATAWAICDGEGFYHEAQPRFLDFIEQYFPDNKAQCLPFWHSDFIESSATRTKEVINGLSVVVENHQKLFLVGIRPASVIDQLTDREREVVTWITQGLTYKEVARKIGLAPSTVSNHLYRVYNKLGISSKTELANLKHQFESE